MRNMSYKKKIAKNTKSHSPNTIKHPILAFYFEQTNGTSIIVKYD